MIAGARVVMEVPFPARAVRVLAKVVGGAALPQRRRRYGMLAGASLEQVDVPALQTR